MQPFGTRGVNIELGFDRASRKQNIIEILKVPVVLRKCYTKDIFDQLPS